MKYTCQKVNISDSGIGVQVQFKNLNNNKELYFLIQSHNGEETYIETHDFEKAGHYRPKIKLGKSQCTFEYGDNTFEIVHHI